MRTPCIWRQLFFRGEQLGRRSHVDLSIVGCIAETLRSLLPGIEQKQDRRHLDASLDHYRKARKDLDDLATEKSRQLPIHPQYVAKVLDELAADDAIFTADVGTPVIWAVH